MPQTAVISRGVNGLINLISLVICTSSIIFTYLGGVNAQDPLVSVSTDTLQNLAAVSSVVAASPSLTTSISASSVAPSPTTPVAMKAAVCGPIRIGDHGTFIFSNSSLLTTAGPYVATQITYLATSYPDGTVTPTQFTQDDVNNGRVTYTPNVGLLTIGSSKTSSVTFIVSDPIGDTVNCIVPITIFYEYAPVFDTNAVPVISTQQFQPVVIDTTVVNVVELHQMSTWYLNWTSIGSNFNVGGKGRLEYYSPAIGWIPLSLSQPFPHEWIVQKSIRYNPTSFNGTTNIVLQLGQNLNFTMTAPIPIVNISVTSAVSTSKVVGTSAAPPYASVYCWQTYPQPFVNSFVSTVGPYCASFLTAATTPYTFTTPFLQSTLVVTTSAPANVTFGFAISIPSTVLPANYVPITFAGYMDYGAFSFSITPASALTSAVFTTPEMTYDQALAITTTSQVTALRIDPTSNTVSASFINNVKTSAPPQLSMNLYQNGYYMICKSSGKGAVAAGPASVQYGPTIFIGAWGQNSFTYPTTVGVGTLQVDVTSSVDFSFNVAQNGVTIWIPPVTTRLDYFTISGGTVATTGAFASFSMGLVYRFQSGALASQGISIKSVQFGYFANSIDGGAWDFNTNFTVDAVNELVYVNITSKQLGQWGVFVTQSAGFMVQGVNRLLFICVGASLAWSLL